METHAPRRITLPGTAIGRRPRVAIHSNSVSDAYASTLKTTANGPETAPSKRICNPTAAAESCSLDVVELSARVVDRSPSLQDAWPECACQQVEVLDRPDVGDDDTFVSLEGDSLSYVAASVRLERALVRSRAQLDYERADDREVLRDAQAELAGRPQHAQRHDVGAGHDRGGAGGRHRIETIAQADGVTWVDDSKATNPSAAASSMQAFDSIVWIAGGQAKGTSFDELVPAMAKRLATDSGSKIVNDALQLFGGYGYLKDYPIERFWRDLRVHSILEGTNQVMRMIVGRELSRQ